MKRNILALILIIGVIFCVYGQSSSPIDLVLVLDTSSNMGFSHEAVNNYITGAFLTEYLRLGDTFHFITFSGTPKLDTARRILGSGDVETIIGRMLLHYPIEAGSDAGTALNFTEEYIATLPSRQKKIVLITTSSGYISSIASAANARLNSHNATLDIVSVTPGQPLTNLPRSGRPAAVASAQTRPAAAAQTPTTTQSSQPASQTPTTTQSSQPASQTPATTQSSQPASQTPTTTQTTQPTSQTPATTQSSQSASQTPATTQSSQSTSQTPSTTQSSQPASQTPATTQTSSTSQTPATTQSSQSTSQTPATTQTTQPTSQTPSTTQSSSTATEAPSDVTQSSPAVTQAPSTSAQTSPPATQTSSTSAPAASSQSSARAERTNTGGGFWSSSLPLIIGIIILALLLFGLLAFFILRRLNSGPKRVIAAVTAPESEQKKKSLLKKAEQIKSVEQTKSVAQAKPVEQTKPVEQAKPVERSKEPSYAAVQTKQRTTPYSDRSVKTDNTKTVTISPDGPLLLNLFVEEQNTSIGKRNIHSLKSGYSLNVGGGKSDFLIFLVPIPANIGEIRRNGSQLTFIPKKPKYFPDLGSSELKDCINQTIRIVSDKNYEMRFRFEMYEDPLVELQRILHSVKVPG